MEKYLLDLTPLSDTEDYHSPTQDTFLSTESLLHDETPFFTDNEAKIKKPSKLLRKKEILIKGKTFSHTTICCDKKCSNSFSMECQERIFYEFYLADYNKQTTFIIDSISVQPVFRHYTSKTLKKRLNTRRYYLNDDKNQRISVCKVFFRSVLRISDGCIHRLLKDKQNFDSPNSSTVNSDLINKHGDVNECLGGIDELLQSTKEIQSSEDANSVKGPAKEVPIIKEVQSTKEETIIFYASPRNIRKINRTSGLPYINSQGDEIPGKEFAPITNCCKQKCFSQFTVKTQRKLFKTFYSFENYNSQNAFIFNHVQVVPVTRHYKSAALRQRNNTRRYNLRDNNDDLRVVCKYFFGTLLAISDGRINRVLQGSAPPIDKRGLNTPGNKTSDDKVGEVLYAIEKFSGNYQVKVVSKKNGGNKCTIRDLYKLYCESVKDHVSEAVFRSIYKSNCKKTDK